MLFLALVLMAWLFGGGGGVIIGDGVEAGFDVGVVFEDEDGVGFGLWFGVNGLGVVFEFVHVFVGLECWELDNESASCGKNQSRVSSPYNLSATINVISSPNYS